MLIDFADDCVITEKSFLFLWVFRVLFYNHWASLIFLMLFIECEWICMVIHNFTFVHFKINITKTVQPCWRGDARIPIYDAANCKDYLTSIVKKNYILQRPLYSPGMRDLYLFLELISRYMFVGLF